MRFLKKFFATFFILQILTPGWTRALAESTDNPLPYQEWAVLIQYKKENIDIKNQDELAKLQNTLDMENKKISEVIAEENIILVEKEENFLENIFRRIGGISAEESTKNLIQHYQNDENVESVQPNFIYKIIDDAQVAENFSNPTFSEKSTEISKKSNQNNNITFNDPLFSKQWYLENNGNRISGMDEYYRKIGKLIFPDGTEWQEEKISQLINVFTQSEENIDIDYLKARKIYNTARERLSEKQKQKKLTIAIIDDGVNYNLPELSGKMWNGENCVLLNSQEWGNCQHGYNVAMDEKNGINKWDNFHGTQIANIIAANENNNEGITGIAPDVEIMAINIQNDDRKIYTSNIVKWINFANVNNADLINLSIGSAKPVNINNINQFDKLMYLSISTFPGLVINAAGNESTNLDNDTSVSFPAVFSRSFVVDDIRYDALENFITVGSIQQNGRMSWFSNYGINTVQIIAPGSNILTSGRSSEWLNTEFENTNYDMVSGTSFAAPITLAAFAFAKSAYPERSWEEIKNIIQETITKHPIYNTKAKYAGILNLWNTMERLEREYQPPEALRGEIMTNTSNWTNSDVSLLLKTNKDISTPDGWTKIKDRVFHKNISQNQELNIQLQSEEEIAQISYSVTNIDKELPHVEIVLPKNSIESHQNFENIAFRGNDNQSWIHHFECKTNTGNWQSCQSPYTFILEKNTKNIFFIKSIDNAGNISTEKNISIDSRELNSIANTHSHESTSRNHANNSGAGGVISSPNNLNFIQEEKATPNNEESQNSEDIIFSSAPIQIETTHITLPKFLINSTYIDQSNNKNFSILEIQNILKKNWILKDNIFHSFSIQDKIQFLDKLTILENSEKENFQNFINKQKEILKIQKYFWK